MKNTFRLNATVVLLVAAFLLAARPDFLAASAIPPQPVTSGDACLPAADTALLAEGLEKAGLALTPCEINLVAADPGLYLADGGSALGAVLVILAIVGITALILNATGHRVRVETRTGG